MVKQAGFVSNLHAGAFGLLLLLLSACASLPEVQAPLPSAEDSSEQVRTFNEATPDQVLQAAEIVLREHLPDAKFIREHESLTVDDQHAGFYLLLDGTSAEKWVLLTRRVGSSTIASVATSAHGFVFFFGYSGSWVWPIEPGFLRPGLRVDYSMFWNRLKSVLESNPRPECEPEIRKPFFHIQKGKVLYKTYEPLCRKYKLVIDDGDE